MEPKIHIQVLSDIEMTLAEFDQAVWDLQCRHMTEETMSVDKLAARILNDNLHRANVVRAELEATK